jgi:hypothetical protein
MTLDGAMELFALDVFVFHCCKRAAFGHGHGWLKFLDLHDLLLPAVSHRLRFKQALKS